MINTTLQMNVVEFLRVFLKSETETGTMNSRRKAPSQVFESESRETTLSLQGGSLIMAVLSVVERRHLSTVFVLVLKLARAYSFSRKRSNHFALRRYNISSLISRSKRQED